jgi:hypothetical protein
MIQRKSSLKFSIDSVIAIVFFISALIPYFSYKGRGEQMDALDKKLLIVVDKTRYIDLLSGRFPTGRLKRGAMGIC